MTALISSVFPGIPTMPALTVSNHLIGNRAELDAAWERDGYWFFKGVLDKGAVARLRGVFLDVLNDLQVVESGEADDAVYNGASLDGYPITMGGDPTTDPLLARHPRDEFVNDPSVKALFEELFGGEVLWVPNTEYHAVPPRKAVPESRFNYVHADGPNNKGLPLRICWIPVGPVDEATGGLALTEGLHKPRMNDFPRAAEGIKEQDVPAEAWRRALYEPGDLVMFSLETPHSGLANLSEKNFRLSMDIRGMLKSGNVPVIGKVAAIDKCAISVEDEDGQQHVFRLDPDTFCRIYRGRMSGIPLKLDEIPDLVEVGSPVYVASDHGTATFIRPQH